MIIAGLKRVVTRWVRKMEQFLGHWMVYFSENPSNRVNQLFLFLATKVRLLLVFFLDGWYGEVQVWEGSEINSGKLLKVTYLGDLRSYKVRSPEYLQSILFEPNTVKTFSLGKFWMLHVRSRAMKLANSADLVILESNKLLRFRPPHHSQSEWWRVAPWVRMVMKFPRGHDWADIEQAMHSQRKNLNIVLRPNPRFKGSFKISHSTEDFDVFYERMHVPLMTERYGQSAQMDSKEGMRKLFADGLLMLIQDGSQPVAGALNIIRSKTMFGIGLGVLDGDKQWYSLGAVTLLYYHSIRWCYENGMSCLDFGGVRPFQKDGLYEYKRRWGFQPYEDIWLERDWLFWVPSANPTALAWIKENPFIMSIKTHNPSEPTVK